MSEPGGLELVSTRLGALPLVNHVLERLGLPALLQQYVPTNDARVKLAPAVAIRLVVANLVLGREPLYGLGEWAARYAPELLGLTGEELGVLNDDRVGRALESLFDSDRGSLLTAVVLTAVAAFDVDTSTLHNDSTSISVSGVYRDATGTPRGTKPTPVITYGHSKDHRPDLKQLVWILTVAADGAVPITYRLTDGNTSDDPTHIPTWNGLVELLGRTDFLYVADAKLCSSKAMEHIDSAGGRFITMLPRGRTDDRYFRTWCQTNTPTWTEAIRQPGARIGDPEQVHYTCPAPQPSTAGYRIVWVHSTAKASHDESARANRIKAGVAALAALDTKLVGPRCRIHSRADAEDTAQRALTGARASRWVSFTVTETITEQRKQLTPGRPGPNTRYRQIRRTHYRVAHHLNAETITFDAITDGCFPLITNTTVQAIPDAEVLTNYRYQPNLERRHHLLKSVQDAAPVLLHNPARIEALFCCQFLALLVSALLEREVRNNMARTSTDHIPLYPEYRNCPAPSTERILEIFSDTARHDLYQHGALVQTFPPELTTQQLQILDLLGLPATKYTKSSPRN